MRSIFILSASYFFLHSFKLQDIAKGYITVSDFKNATDTIVLDTLFIHDTTTTDDFKGFKFKHGEDVIFKFIVTNLLNYTLDVSATSGDGGLVILGYKELLAQKESEEMFYIFHTKGRIGPFSKTMTIVYKPRGKGYENQKAIFREVRGVIE